MTLEETLCLFARNNIGQIDEVYNWEIPTNFPSGNIVSSSCMATDSKNLKIALNNAWKEGDANHKANLEKWYVVDFGGVKRNKSETLSEYASKTSSELISIGKKGIASWSKMLCVRNPLEYPIFDARVAISLNCLLRSSGLLHQGKFPVLESQNNSIKRANNLLKNIRPSPADRINFYTEYCSTLKNVAVKISTPKKIVTVMDLEMLLFALAPSLIEEHLILRN